MYKDNMNHYRLVTKTVLLFFIISIFFSGAAYSQTAVRDTVTLQIAQYIWNNRFDSAITKIDHIIATEEANPLGYFLRGTIHQGISEEFRTDRFNELITENLDKAIELSKDYIESDSSNPDWHFICGASYGYRALHRAFHGGWWGAFRDGLHASSYLNEALKIDSTFYDAYLGLGAYHYYKTVKSKIFLWLPFVADRREQGIEEIKKCINNGYLATINARQSLLRIYFEEQEYEKMFPLSDSLKEIIPDDSYNIYYRTRGLVESNRLDEAQESLQQLKLLWKESPYFDPIGMFETEVIEADILARDGDIETAKTIVNRIIADKGLVKENAYYGETLEYAKRLAKKIR